MPKKAPQVVAFQKSGQTQKKNSILLLVCKCGQCTHWEIAAMTPPVSTVTLICATCKETIPLGLVHVPPHNRLHWETHER